MCGGVTVSGYTLSTLWEWFVSDTFGVQKITLLQGYGLALIGAYFNLGNIQSLGKRLDGDKEAWYERPLIAILACLFLLAIGFVVKSFM